MTDTSTAAAMELADQNTRNVRVWLFRRDLPPADLLAQSQLSLNNAELLKALAAERDELVDQLKIYTEGDTGTADLMEQLTAARERISELAQQNLRLQKRIDVAKDLIRVAVRRFTMGGGTPVANNKWRSQAQHLLNSMPSEPLPKEVLQ